MLAQAMEICAPSVHPVLFRLLGTRNQDKDDLLALTARSGRDLDGVSLLNEVIIGAKNDGKKEIQIPKHAKIESQGMYTEKLRIKLSGPIS